MILTPLYDLAIRYLTRENAWRFALVKQINPKPGDRILDVGCGTGSLLAALAHHCPGADFIGLDPDKEAIKRAYGKSRSDNIGFVTGFLDEEILPKGWQPTKITSSLMFHQVSLRKKKEIVDTMSNLLGNQGEIHIADYAQQSTLLMRLAFRMTVQLLDGVEDTQHNADGILEKILISERFLAKKTASFGTAPGSISLFRLQKAH